MRPTATVLTLLFAATLATPALAAWPHHPLVNLPVCTAPDGQYGPMLVSDGAGGAVIAWYDFRGGVDADIYAQHVLASGAVDPAWPADGRALCVTTGAQIVTSIVADGSGGAIVVWQDERDANSDVYAQHVLASGDVDPGWPVNGRALCTAAQNQITPLGVADGAGGVVVAWMDFRSGIQGDVYAQHVLASGGLDPAWSTNGQAVCAAAGDKASLAIASDGAGGAIVTWSDYRNPADSDIYVQRMLAAGAVDPAWPAAGRALCNAIGYQLEPAIVADGAGGAIVTWYDLRDGSFADIYAHHVLASGSVDFGWPTNGRALCTATGTQGVPKITSDGLGGAIVAWQDYRGGSNADIYAQHVQSSGAVDPLWPANGSALCTAAQDQTFHAIAPDGTGGAIVSWQDQRDGTRDVYAQHVLATGNADPVWPVNGRAVCTAGFDQFFPTIVADGGTPAGSGSGAIVAWHDLRSGLAHIYAQRVEGLGRLGNPEPAIASVADVPYDNGGHVKLSWAASYLDASPAGEITNYEIWRSIPPGEAQARLSCGARLLRADDGAPAERSEALRTTTSGAQTIYWEYVASQPARRFAGYSYALATTGDSIAAGIPALQAMVLAFSNDGLSYWASAPMAGYSVDNLAPVAPAPFTGQFATGTALLHWQPNAEGDLAGYRLYRGSSLAFVPDESNLVAALPDTGFADAAGAPYVYKLTAVDVHGNESPVTTLSLFGTADVGDGANAAALAFRAPSPNPAATRTTLRFSLPSAGHARLAVYDLSGRLVRVLFDGAKAAGAHAADWDLRDESGARVRAGLFFARLDTDGRELRQRVIVMR